MPEYQQHPVGATFPQLKGIKRERLKASIEANGQRNPIKVYDGRILDGWNRYTICQELGIDPIFETVPATVQDLFEYVADQNSHRRELTISQRALIAARMMTTPRTPGRQLRAKENENSHWCEFLRLADAARLMEVSERAVSQARTVDAESQPPVVDAVHTGDVTVKDAYNVLKKVIEPLETDDEKNQAREDELTALAEVLQNKADGKEEYNTLMPTIERIRNRRTQDEIPPPPEGKYNVIVCDPPWPVTGYAPKGRTGDEALVNKPSGNQETSRHHGRNKDLVYAKMKVTDIAKMGEEGKIPAADDCFLFLWTTQKYLPEALMIVGEWGFAYHSTMVWHKQTGPQSPKSMRSNCEFIVVAKKGKIAWYETKGLAACNSWPRGKDVDHSAKPEAFYDLLRRVTRGKRIDLFNRREIDGFDGWGMQSPT